MLEAVPNFSEGRDEGVVDALRGALSSPARLLDVHVDADHHRSVFTLVGEPDELVETLLAGIACARERIDLRRHDGAHPRIGAADVVPIVPIKAGDLERAKEVAGVLARRVGEELSLPVFLYGELAPGRGPAFFRRGGPEELQRRIDAGELAPDFGPERLDEQRGGGDRRRAPAADRVQRQPARRARGREGGCGDSCGRRAAASPACARWDSTCRARASSRCSMNVEDWEAAALHEIVARIEEEAAAHGAEVVGSELVGLMPAGAAAAAAGAMLRIDGFDESHVLELRLVP